MKHPQNETAFILLGLLLSFALLTACSTPLTAEEIISKARSAHGSHLLDHANVSFDFRDKHYRMQREGGLFSYQRIYSDSTGDVVETLNNDELFKEVNGARVALDSALFRSVERGVNSVIYFALLPYNLADPAVRSRLLGETTIEDQPYYEVEIVFTQEGGGRDYQDRFIYWFHRDNFTMDYLAYDYIEDEGGTRFRKAINPRTIEGIRFSDYINYSSEIYPNAGDPIQDFELHYENDSLNVLSEIITENISVELTSQ